MEYGKLLDSLPYILKMKYRNYENLVKKYINAEWSKLFNSICLKSKITVEHLRIQHFCHPVFSISPDINESQLSIAQPQAYVIYLYDPIHYLYSVFSILLGSAVL